jgi:hypothetical protein
VYHFGDGEWIDEPVETFPPSRRLKIPAGQTAFIVEIGSESQDGSFAQFRQLILDQAAPDLTTTDSGPSVRYTNRHGRTLEYHWDGDVRRLDGANWAFPSDMLFQSGFMDAAVNTGAISIIGNNASRLLDFNTLRIEETPVPSE